MLAHICVLAGLLGASLTAGAQSAPVHRVALEWQRSSGAEACIEASELVQRVEARLGHEVFSSTNDALVIIDGSVTPAAPHGFSAMIRVTGSDGALYGSREVSVPDPDCRKLDDVVALIISVTLRHEGIGGIALPENIAALLSKPEPEPEPVADRPLPPPPPPASPPSKPAEPLWNVRLEAGFGLTTGLTPAVNLGPLVRLELELQKRYSLALEGRLALPQTQRISSEPRGSFVYRSDTFALLACASPLRAAALALAVCVDGRVAHLSVQPEDFVYSYGAGARWIEVALAGGLRLALLGPTFAHLRAAVPWRVAHPRFKYQSSQGDLRDAFQLARFGLDLSLSVGVEF